MPHMTRVHSSAKIKHTHRISGEFGRAPREEQEVSLVVYNNRLVISVESSIYTDILAGAEAVQVPK